MSSDEREEQVMHLLNAYTWAGRRGACAVTSENLRCSENRAEVTCQTCLAVLHVGPTA